MQLQVTVGVRWFEKYQGILQSRYDHVLAGKAQRDLCDGVAECRGTSFRNVVL